MAWPKGRPRKQVLIPPGQEGDQEGAQEGVGQASVAAHVPPRPRSTASRVFSGGSRWTMKAGANWESASNDEDGVDKLHIPRDMIPDGMDLQWVTNSVLGEETRQHRGSYERKGWTPVHPEDFDGRFEGMFTPRGHQGEINYEGLVLMARPLEMSRKARERQQREARELVKVKEAMLTGGGLEGVTLQSDHDSARRFNHINRSWERIGVPKE